MSTVMQHPGALNTNTLYLQSRCQFPAKISEAAPLQQPTVINIRRKTDLEVITELLNKLPMPAPTRKGDRDVKPSSVHPTAAFLEQPWKSNAFDRMTKKLFAQLPSRMMPAGVGAPPGLQPCCFHPHPGQAINDFQGLGLPFVKNADEFSLFADGEQSSTNDGEHDTCVSSFSEEEIVHRGTGEEVPKNLITSNINPQMLCSAPCAGGMTTLMIRNVPVMYTQEMLLLEWKNEGTYDFLYLPRTGQTNLSYAFVNFESEAHAMAFKVQWHKKRMAHFTARKPLNISFADVQGLRANLLQLKKKRARRIEMRQCQPMIIKNGRQLDLMEALAVMEK